jgi:hypothetical protein
MTTSSRSPPRDMPRELHTGVDFELLEDVAKMSIDGVRGDEELGSAARLRSGRAWPIDAGSEPGGLLYRYGNTSGY